jgi:hypothetical protein
MPRRRQQLTETAGSASRSPSFRDLWRQFGPFFNQWMWDGKVDFSYQLQCKPAFRRMSTLRKDMLFSAEWTRSFELEPVSVDWGEATARTLRGVGPIVRSAALT